MVGFFEALRDENLSWSARPDRDGEPAHVRELDKLRALVEILANELCSSGAIAKSALDRQVALALDRLANAREVAAGTPVVACARCGNTFWLTRTEDMPIGRCCAACAATR